jgi:hypothetical protein
MAGILERITKQAKWFVERPTERRFFRKIPSERVRGDLEPGLSGEAFEAEASYFSIRIVELYLQNAGEYFRNFFPMAVTLSEFTRGDEARAVPFFLNNDKLKTAFGERGSSLGYVEMNDVYVLKHVPVNAGGLSLFCGLFRVVEKDFAGAFIDLLGELSGRLNTFGIPYDAEMARTVYGRVSSLLGMSGTEFRFGHLDGAILGKGSGYHVYAGAANGSPYMSDIWMKEGRLCHGADAAARPVTECDYCVLAIERLRSRATAAFLPSLPFNTYWAAAVRSLTAKEDDKAEVEFGKLQAEVLLSPEITEEDRLIAVSLYQKKWADVLAITRPSPGSSGTRAGKSLRSGTTVASFRNGLAKELTSRKGRGSGSENDPAIRVALAVQREIVAAAQKPIPADVERTPEALARITEEDATSIGNMVRSLATADVSGQVADLFTSARLRARAGV